jgi:hypothetical protein
MGRSGHRVVAGALGAALAIGAPARAQETACTQAIAAQKVAEYGAAAELFELCAQRFAAASGADVALSDAIVLRLALGQREQALADVETYLRTYGARNPAFSASVVLAAALSHAEHEEWARSLDVLSRHAGVLQNGPIDLQLAAHVAKGRALLHGPKPALAYEELAAARALYAGGATLEAELAKAWPADTEGQRARRLAKALNAAGDALVLLADREQATRVATLRPPVYTGPRSEGALQAHLATKVPAWMEKRARALADLDAAYLAVVDMRPMPPPRAVIAAAGAVAGMWSDYADDLARVVPLDAYPVTVPRGAPPDTPTRAIVTAAIAQVRAPIVQRRVMPAMKKCVEFAVKYQYWDERARTCEAWLAKNDADHFHAASELSPEVQTPRALWAPSPPAR